MDPNELCSAVESILFAAESPVSVKKLQDIFTEISDSAPAKTTGKAAAKAAPQSEAEASEEEPVEAGVEADQTDLPEEGEPEAVETAAPEEVPPFPKEEIESVLEILTERYTGDDRGFELRRANSGYHFVTKPKNVKWVQKFLATKPFRLGKSALEVMSIVAYRQPVTRADIDKVRGIDSGHLLRVLMERGLVKMAGKAEIPGRPVQYGTTPKFLETVGLAEITELPPLSELTELQGERPTKDPLEEGLEKFVRSTEDPEKLEEATQEELAEINDMIAEAEASKDVFESPLHADVASANLESHEAVQASKKRKGRKAEVVNPSDELPPSEEAAKPSPAPQEISYQDLVSSEQDSPADLVAGPASFDAEKAIEEFDAEAPPEAAEDVEAKEPEATN